MSADSGTEAAEAPAGRSFISSLASNQLHARRGRGRPRKSLDVSGAYGSPDVHGEPLDPNSDFVSLQDDNDSEPQEPALAKTRGRGRPKKSDTAESSATAEIKPDADAVTAATQPRKRGRPRKSEIEEVRVASSNPTAQVGPAAVTGQRGRGRPRKSNAVDGQEDSAAEPAEAVKRGRGRPRKSDAVIREEEAVAGPAAAVKRGRGRPRKSVAMQDRPAEEPVEPSDEPAEQGAAAKHDRGRPSKSSAASVKAPLSTASKAKAGGAKKATLTARGRGRPRNSLDNESSGPSVSDTDLESLAQDDSAILRLPPELLTRVFAYLGAVERSDVSAARLVCRSFHQLSSPFLITTVTFAKRLDTVKRLREVLEHPYFSKHVTTLIWDASRYEGRVADDWNEYVERCNRAPRPFFEDDWISTRAADDGMLRNLADIGRPGPNSDFDEAGGLSGGLARDAAVSGASESEDESASSAALSDGLEDSSEQSSDDEALPIPFDESSSGEESDSDDDSNSDSVELMDDEDVLFDRDNMVTYQDRVYRMGCHRGLPDYYRLYVNADKMKGAGLPARILTLAIQRLPKLRHFSFTDYRSLAFAGESYHRLCKRLFGNTLEPTALGLGQRRPWFWHELTEVINVFTGLKRRLSSLSIGEQPFQAYVMHKPQPSQLSVGPGMFRWLARQQKSSHHSSLLDILHGLRSLHLPVAMDCNPKEGGGDDRFPDGITPLVNALSVTGPSLLDLQLVLTGCVSYKAFDQAHPPLTWGEIAVSDEGMPIEADGEAILPYQIFHPLATRLRFERLQTLEIRGWGFDLSDLENFLTAHAGTLRGLHIIDSLCGDSYSAFVIAAQGWSTTLHLAGIEIFGLRFHISGKTGDCQWHHEHDYDGKALHMAELHGKGLRSGWTTQATLQEYPFVRSELEAIAMAGRSNAVVRRAGSMAKAPDGEWWQTPVQL